MKEWFTVQELVGLPGMPGTARGVRFHVQKNLFVSRSKECGKGLEYALKDLPPETQTHIADQVRAQVLACLPAEVAAAGLLPRTLTEQELADTARDTAPAIQGQKGDPLNGWLQTDQQRAVGRARKTVLRYVQRIEDEAGCTTRAAMLAFLTTAAAGRLSGDVSAAVLELSRDSRGRKASNAHPNAQGLPTLRTLQGWLQRAKQAKEEQNGDNLAPRMPQASMELEPWMVLAVELKRRPQKPPTTEVLLQMKAAWPEYSREWIRSNRKSRSGTLATPEQISALAERLTFPSADQLYRFFRNKFNRLDLLAGQHQGSALREHKLFHKRTNAGLMPWHEIHADGWNTHFTAPCPITGTYRTFEVWHFHDVRTGFTPEFSIGYSESKEVIMKGLENCIRVGGVPLFWQTDSTGSVKNKSVEFDPVTSLSARAGLTVVHPATIGNSQANGIPENYNKYLDKKAKALATYQHPSMDTLAFKQERKFTAQMVKAKKRGDAEAYKLARAAAIRVGKGILFESTEQMIVWLEEMRVLSNNTPNSKLPKIVDQATGKRRHQTPQEALDAFIKDGWEPVALSESELAELFYPHLMKTVVRQTVSVEGQRYYHEMLGDYNRKEVMVCVDRMDGSKVWIKDSSGRLLCIAQYIPEVGYRCRSHYEMAEEKRMNAQIKRKENDIEAIKDRRDPDRAPLDVMALEVKTPQVMDFGMLTARRQAEQLTPQTEEPKDFATVFLSAETPEEAADRARQAQEDIERLDMLTRMDVVMQQMLEEQRREAM